MKTLFTSFNYFDGISLTRNDAEKCSHSGECEPDVIEVMNKPYVKNQLSSIDPEKLAKELKEYGAWDSDELKNHAGNCKRIVWIAAGNIVDDLYEKERN